MQKTMRAAVFVEKGRIALREVPVPVPGAGEALLRVTTTTICGTDVHILKGEYPVAPGRIVGHEPVGVIEALLDALGPAGTLVMPAHSGQLSDPALVLAARRPPGGDIGVEHGPPAVALAVDVAAKDPHDRGVVHLAEDLGLLHEAAPEVLISRAHQLDGHLLAGELPVARPDNRGPAPDADVVEEGEASAKTSWLPLTAARRWSTVVQLPGRSVVVAHGRPLGL
mgnify:CR=1 FL=1